MYIVPKYIYALYRGTHEVTLQVVCQPCYDKQSVEGGFMAPLAEREKRHYKQRVEPYKGSRPCETCDDKGVA